MEVVKYITVFVLLQIERVFSVTDFENLFQDVVHTGKCIEQL